MQEEDKVARGRRGMGPLRREGFSRREVFRRAGALGLSGAMLGGFLGGGAVPARAAGYDPKKYAGTKLGILMTGDENDHRALGDLLPQLEAETGIRLEITSPALGALIEK